MEYVAKDYKNKVGYQMIETTSQPEWCIGLMSGTSLDGVDASLLRTDGKALVKEGESYYLPYPEEFRTRMKTIFGTVTRDRKVESLEEELTKYHVDAVQQLLAQSKIKSSEVAYIGFHGQTIYHDPAQGVTIQLGNGKDLAAKTDIPVIFDFRSNDVNAGGEGAPLAPVYHKALVESLSADKIKLPVAILNLGGVGNVTYIGSNGELIAFDTGPANALMDDFILKHSGVAFDEGGKIAATGKASERKLKEWLTHPYFNRPYPKSLDRDDFAHVKVDDHTLEDGLATLLEFTVASVIRASSMLPEVPHHWLVTGGGRKNHKLMDLLNKKLEGSVRPVEDMGWNGDAIEAQAFAFMAKRSAMNLPISFPLTTGVSEEKTGGKIALPPA